MNRLATLYHQTVLPELKKELNLNHNLAVPRLKKVVINVGVTEPQQQKQALDSVVDQLSRISGQKPKITSAKKSIAGFKLREGDPIGVMVTLRGHRMYQFLDKLINIVLPRVKDFQGVSATAFDQNGNYSLGIQEQITFPEIDYDKIDKVRSLQVTIVSSASNPQEAKLLLTKLQMPFRKEQS